MKKSAQFSPCKTYRYCLTRQWDQNLPFVNFIGLNPSIANASVDDPTIKKCIGYAKAWGYGGLIMTNLFAFVSSDPECLFQYQGDKIGPDNDKYLKKGYGAAEKTIAAWGNRGTYNCRAQKVRSFLGDLYCLKMNTTGQPCHPLYQPKNMLPIKLVEGEMISFWDWLLFLLLVALVVWLGVWMLDMLPVPVPWQ